MAVPSVKIVDISAGTLRVDRESLKVVIAKGQEMLASPHGAFDRGVRRALHRELRKARRYLKRERRDWADSLRWYIDRVRGHERAAYSYELWGRWSSAPQSKRDYAALQRYALEDAGRYRRWAEPIQESITQIRQLVRETRRADPTIMNRILASALRDKENPPAAGSPA